MEELFFERKEKMTDRTMDRIDGKLKVTGKAKYAAEHVIPGITYGVLVNSTIAKGKIKNIDSKAAEAAAGVLAVVSHLNAPPVPGYKAQFATPKKPAEGKQLRIFQNADILSDGQPIAIVVAKTFEQATYAASLVKVSYDKAEHKTDFEGNLSTAVEAEGDRFKDYLRGKEAAYKTAPVFIEQEYMLPNEVHNPMEMHSLIAQWNGDSKITVYDKTQGVKMTQKSIMTAFELSEENVSVISPFVGGAFGGALRTWPHEIGAILAAKKVGKPVKLMLARNQMFSMVGYRPQTWQKIGIGATADGKFVGITHEAIGQTSSHEKFTEGAVEVSRNHYACPNVDTKYRLVELDINTPAPMRGPGHATGAYALESAIDELAHKLKMDPLQMRIINHADTDPEKNLPWSSKFVKEAYEKGSEKIGWKNRKMEPGTLKENGLLAGYGMSMGTFGAFRLATSAKASLLADGTLLIQSAVSDIGPGTGIAMVRIASDTFGIPQEKIKFEMGDSKLPNAPVQGGSFTGSSAGSAVHDACIALKKAIAESAQLTGDIVIANGQIYAKEKPAAKTVYADLIKKNNGKPFEVSVTSKAGDEQKKYSFLSWSIHFAKVLVNPRTGVVKVDKVVTVADSGKILSPKTARSQMVGGVTGGIGMALTEEVVMDHRYGRYINNNLADYHVPVNADVPYIDTIFIDKPDPYINPMGSKGMGEIALIGFAAAITNAVFNATGKRVRDLPVTPDKLI